MPSNTDLAGPAELTPPILAASQNDWGPDASGGATTWYLSASSAVNLTGLAGGRANRVIRLVNVGTFAITLKAQSSSSLAVNRFLTPVDVSLGQGGALSLVYVVAGSTSGWSTLDATKGTGTLLLATASSTPAAPDTGIVALWNQQLGGRMTPMFRGPLTGPVILGPSYARGQVCHWQPSGAGSGAAPTGNRYNTVTTLGTLTGRNCASTSLATRQIRLGIVSSSTAGNFAAARTGGQNMTVGTGVAGVGGFYKVQRFICSDAATVAGARQFVGISNLTSAPTNVEPSTLTTCVGVGHGASDTNLKIFYGGSAAQTPIDLGANFPANTLSADLYELVLFAPSISSDVYYQVTRVNTGDVASGQIVNSGATVLPAATQWLNYLQMWRCNNATALAVALDFVTDYVEIDV